MTHPSVADHRCGHNYEPQDCPWDTCEFKRVIAERDALKAAEAARQEREAQATQAKAWIEAAAKKHRIPADAIRGNTEEEINAHAEALSALVPPKGYVPNEGERPSGDGTSELRDFTRQLFSKE